MAKITFNLEELIQILTTNKLLPPEIIRLRVQDQSVHFVINTDSFVLPFIPASVRYLNFNNGRAEFELTFVGTRQDQAISLLNQALKLRLPPYAKLQYPKILVDVDMMLKEKNIRGIQVKNVTFANGEFTIITAST
jgi:hypothetical protein